jgi:hypothetical protein
MTYIENLCCRLNFLVFQAEVDAGGGEEGAFLVLGAFNLGRVRLAHGFTLGHHELDSGLGIPVLIHVGVFLVSRQKWI